MFPIQQTLIDPEFETVNNGTFTIPAGWTVGMVKNTHAANPLKMVNEHGKEMMVGPGEVYHFPYRSAGRSALLVEATGASAAIGYEL